MRKEENINTTIKLSKITVARLAARGKKGDTYEEIILRLLDKSEASFVKNEVGGR